jgi:RNA polymerase sigma factor (sigma-70 family)
MTRRTMDADQGRWGNHARLEIFLTFFTGPSLDPPLPNDDQDVSPYDALAGDGGVKMPIGGRPVDGPFFSRLLAFAKLALRKQTFQVEVDRQDLEQEVAVAAYYARRVLVTEDEERALVFGIARHKVVDYLRKRSVRGEVEVLMPPHFSAASQAANFDEDDSIDPQSARFTPEERAAVRDFLNSVRGCLSDQEHAAIILHVVDGEPHDRVGELLGIGESLAKNRIRSARAKLRKEMDKQGIRLPAVFIPILRAEWPAGHFSVEEGLAQPPVARVRGTTTRASREPRRHNRPSRFRTLGGLLALLLTCTLVSRHRELGELPGQDTIAVAAASASFTAVPAAPVAERAAMDDAVAVTVVAALVPVAKSRTPAARTPRTSRRSAPAAQTSRVGAGSGTDPDDSLLLVRARGAFHNEDYATCLDLLEEHRRRFPNGRFAPDRDALWTEAREHSAPTRPAPLEARAVGL